MVQSNFDCTFLLLDFLTGSTHHINRKSPAHIPRSTREFGFAPWLGCGGVYSDVGSALGGVLCPALTPSQAPPLVRRTQDTPCALTLAATWLAPTSQDTLPLAHPLALATPSGLQPLGESGSTLQGAVVFIGYAWTPHWALTIPAVMSERALLSWGD